MNLHEKLYALEIQKQVLEKEIYQLKQAIEKQSPFSKNQKIELFKSLFVIRDDVYALYW